MAGDLSVSSFRTHRRSRSFTRRQGARPDGRAIIPDNGGPAASRAVGGQPGAYLRALGGDQATPDAVLADVPVPQGQRQALAAHRAGRADSDRHGRLLASDARLSADREPLIRIKTALSAPGVCDDLSPQRPTGEGARHRSRHVVLRDHRG